MINKFVSKIKYLISLVSLYHNSIEVISYRLFHTKLKQVILRNGLIISGNSNSEILSVSYEIFYQKVYMPNFMKLKKGDTVVDIGGHIGTFTLFALYNGAGKVYAFEPVPKNYEMIKQNLRQNKYNNAKLTCVAVSDKKGTEKLFTYDMDAGNTLKRHGDVYTDIFIKVPTITLTEIINENKLKKIDFLKVDCEGSEGDIIKSTSDKLLKRIKKFAIEYHDNVSSLNHIEIEKRFKNLGFNTRVKPTGNSPFGYLYAWQLDK